MSLVASRESKTKSNIDCLQFSLEQSRTLIKSFIPVCLGLSGCTVLPNHSGLCSESPLTTLSIKPCPLVSYSLVFLFVTLFITCSYLRGAVRCPLPVSVGCGVKPGGISHDRTGLCPWLFTCLSVTTVSIPANRISR